MPDEAQPLHIPSTPHNLDWLPACKWSSSEVSCETSFTVPADFPFFAGHFEGNPLVPAYVQATWMLAAARRLQPSTTATFRQVKWLQPIRPGANLLLRATRTEASVEASVSSEGATVARATIILS
ncbi:MAG: hypothetical protein SFY80_14960 [Verrucomicrobiota bacterium]|nr:hypothetical protein [Verrucomicrobiota bacterium]